MECVIRYWEKKCHLLKMFHLFLFEWKILPYCGEMLSFKFKKINKSMENQSY